MRNKIVDSEPAKKDIAHYLDQFSDSPYRLPTGSGRQIVDGVSTLKGSWIPPGK